MITCTHSFAFLSSCIFSNSKLSVVDRNLQASFLPIHFSTILIIFFYIHVPYLAYHIYTIDFYSVTAKDFGTRQKIHKNKDYCKFAINLLNEPG